MTNPTPAVEAVDAFGAACSALTATSGAAEVARTRAALLALLRQPEAEPRFENLTEREKAQVHAAPSPTPAPSVADIEERERMRLAGISTAAQGYWKEGDSIHSDYDTVALRDVAKLYAEYVTRTNERDSYKAGAERMQDALRVMARQKLSAEVSEEDRENADYEAGYEALVRQARATIAQRGGKGE